MKKILVVDDDESIVEVVQLVLESEGYYVQTNMDGDLLPLLKKEQPNLILLDMLLSGVDGRDICKQLKSDHETAHIPVIMLSAHSETDKAANASGANDFLEKPFDVDALIAIVEKHLASNSPKIRP